MLISTLSPQLGEGLLTCWLCRVSGRLSGIDGVCAATSPDLRELVPRRLIRSFSAQSATRRTSLAYPARGRLPRTHGRGSRRRRRRAGEPTGSALGGCPRSRALLSGSRSWRRPRPGVPLFSLDVAPSPRSCWRRRWIDLVPADALSHRSINLATQGASFGRPGGVLDRERGEWLVRVRPRCTAWFSRRGASSGARSRTRPGGRREPNVCAGPVLLLRRQGAPRPGGAVEARPERTDKPSTPGGSTPAARR